jgi:hypothetical protein
VEVDRVVPPSGNLWIGGQQVWLGPALAGRQITVWADAISLYVLAGGARLQTLPPRLGTAGLSQLAANGARPADPCPLPAGQAAVIEVDRTVNASGTSAWPPIRSASAPRWPGSGSPCAWKDR